MERNFLTKTELQKKAPAIYTTSKKPELSTRYSFFNTENLIDNFEKLGWYPVKADQIKSKNSVNYGKHMLRFSQNIVDTTTKDLIPEIVVFNSHNGRSKLSIQLGLFRFVCSNGLIVCDTNYLKVDVKHIGIDLESLKSIIDQILKAFNNIKSKIDQYKNTQLSYSDTFNFAEKAINMIYDTENKTYIPENILNPVRKEDEKADLFTVMNVIQENILNGNSTYIKNNKIRKSRKIKSIDKDLKINTLLWALMDNFLQNKSF